MTLIFFKVTPRTKFEKPDLMYLFNVGFPEIYIYNGNDKFKKTFRSPKDLVR